jgi:hypothetical protein
MSLFEITKQLFIVISFTLNSFFHILLYILTSNNYYCIVLLNELKWKTKRDLVSQCPRDKEKFVAAPY